MAERRKSYAEQLKDPRWQKKRLEILERDAFTCRRCSSAEKTLHVHHRYYERGLMVWEYPDETLESLCEECHPQAQSELEDAHRAIALGDRSTPDRVLGYLAGCQMLEDPEWEWEFRRFTLPMMVGASDALRINYGIIFKTAADGEPLTAEVLYRNATNPTRQSE